MADKPIAPDPMIQPLTNIYASSARWIREIANDTRSAELAIIISYPTSASGIIVLLVFSDKDD